MGTHVSGENFNKSRICPPALGDSAHAASDVNQWIAPSHQDLFVSVTQMEDLASDAASGYETILGAIVFAGLCALGLVAVIWGITNYRAKNKKSQELPRPAVE